ncbi:MAG: adenosylhomocysteinase [Chloroflexi bacterium]|nr:adenosylhomocysteinase [Chloroflexota bacterium]
MATVPLSHDVRDLSLAPDGRRRIEWADTQMPVLRTIRERFERERPLDGFNLAACLHITSETANLAITLQAGGASVRLCASNPLSTNDEVAASLVADFEIPVFAIKGEDESTYYQHIEGAVAIPPHVTMDDGADLVTTLHTRRRDLLARIVGGTEETTTGVVRLRSMEASGVLEYPIVAVNQADTKHLFDNRYGTGQSAIDGIIRATNVLIAGRTVVVCGYGWCGRGVASRAHGMGANVIVTEVDPTRAIEAVMEGSRVMTMAEAARVGDIFVTTTGNIHAIGIEHLRSMHDGAIVANAGHFNVEIDIDAMEQIAAKRRMRPFVDEYRFPDGHCVFLLGEGRLVNLAAAEGHPAAVMDMSFANQALCAEYLVQNAASLDRKVYDVPTGIDREVARLKLVSLGMEIDVLTAEQRQYLESWELGT